MYTMNIKEVQQSNLFSHNSIYVNLWHETTILHFLQLLLLLFLL